MARDAKSDRSGDQLATRRDKNEAMPMTTTRRGDSTDTPMHDAKHAGWCSRVEDMRLALGLLRRY